MPRSSERWTRHWLPEGMEIVVDGYRAKNGAMRAIGRGIAFADGMTCLWIMRSRRIGDLSDK